MHKRILHIIKDFLRLFVIESIIESKKVTYLLVCPMIGIENIVLSFSIYKCYFVYFSWYKLYGEVQLHFL